MVTMTKIADGIDRQLQGYLDRANRLEAYLNRVVVEQYRNIQRKRWQTEGASEGKAWSALSPDYAKWKRVHFRGAPGGGTKIMIASGRLFKNVIGPGPDFRKVTTPRSLTIGTTVPYAYWADEDRSITTYSEASKKEILDGIARFLFKNEVRVPRAF